MRNEENKHWIIDQLERNLVAIFLGAGLVFSQFNNADSNTALEIKQINNKREKLDAMYIRLCRLEANAQLGECK